MKKVLVIVVTFNGMKWLDRCLGSVRSSETPADLYVVDNASADGSADFVEREYPEAVLVRNSENLGFTQANNVGFRYALESGYDFAYLLNQDAWIFPETLGTLVRAFKECGEAPQGKPVGILSPMQMEANLTRMDAQFRKHCGAALGKDPAETVRVPFVMAAHWMLSRDCMEKVGGFSPTFPHYGEDLDYIHRAAGRARPRRQASAQGLPYETEGRYGQGGSGRPRCKSAHHAFMAERPAGVIRCNIPLRHSMERDR